MYRAVEVHVRILGADYLDFGINTLGEIYICYRGPNQTTFIKKFDGEGWVDVGETSDFSDVYGINLAFDPNDGTPYLAFQDDGNSNGSGGRATVIKFDGDNWVAVGDRGFSDYPILNMGYSGRTLGIDSQGYPYLSFIQTNHWSMTYNGSCYLDANGDCITTLNRLIVTKFNGSEWEHVISEVASSPNEYVGSPGALLIDEEKVYVSYYENNDFNYGNPGYIQHHNVKVLTPSVYM